MLIRLPTSIISREVLERHRRGNPELCPRSQVLGQLLGMGGIKGLRPPLNTLRFQSIGDRPTVRCLSRYATTVVVSIGAGATKATLSLCK